MMERSQTDALKADPGRDGAVTLITVFELTVVFRIKELID